MIKVLQALNADDLWQQARSELLNPEAYSMVQSRVGPTREVAHVALSLENPGQKWIVSRNPSINPAFAFVEVVWILRGRQDSSFLNFFNRQLAKYAGTGVHYHGAYGYRMREHFQIDQLERAFLALKNNPESRQVVLSIWSPKLDMPSQDGNAVDPDIPCNLISMLKIRDGKLHWTQVMRSNDIFLGVPHNIVQFTSLQEIMAGWLELGVGTYSHFSDSLHVYTKDVPRLDQSTKVIVERNSDSLSLPKDESDKWFGFLEKRIDILIDQSLTAKKFDMLSVKLDSPQAIENVYCVISAEVARRKNWVSKSELIMSRCTNPVYTQMWERWIERVGKKNDLPSDSCGREK